MSGSTGYLVDVDTDLKAGVEVEVVDAEVEVAGAVCRRWSFEGEGGGTFSGGCWER